MPLQAESVGLTCKYCDEQWIPV